jgi:Fur family ferric uptake transcriptional regulator
MISAEKRVTQAVHEKGYKLTPARRALIGVIAESNSHLTPAEIYVRARHKDPDISLVTTYRTLDMLSRLGFICEVYTDDRSRSYLIRKQEKHHHHIVCSECGRVLDFTGCDLLALENKLAKETGFHIDSHLLEFVGKCRACQKKLNKVDKDDSR